MARVPYNDAKIVLKIVCEGREISLYYGKTEDSMTGMARADMTVISTDKLGCMVGITAGMFATGGGYDVDNHAEFEWFAVYQ